MHLVHALLPHLVQLPPCVPVLLFLLLEVLAFDLLLEHILFEILILAIPTDSNHILSVG